MIIFTFSTVVGSFLLYQVHIKSILETGPILKFCLQINRKIERKKTDNFESKL